MLHEQSNIPESVNHLAEIWPSLEFDQQAFEMAQLRYGSGHFKTVELMGAMDSLSLSKEERMEMKSILGLVSLSDLPMTEEEILHMIDTDLPKARRILDITYAYKSKIGGDKH